MNVSDVFWFGFVVGVAAICTFKLIEYLVVSFLSDKYHVKITRNCLVKYVYEYGCKGLNKNHAIIKALDVYSKAGMHIDEIIDIECKKLI